MCEINDKIKQFNNSKCKILFNEIMNYLYPNATKCMYCGEHILYYDTKIIITRNKTFISGKSFLTKKSKNEQLMVCESCLIKKYPEYNNKNKSKVFNTISYITRYAFNITDLSNYDRGFTKIIAIKRYGEEEGLKRWEIYCNKQGNKNTLKYKNEKFGWSEEQFDLFNKSRAITLDNLIQKYGEVNGLKKWNIYIEKQKTTKSKEYMINKFGIEKTEIINKQKGLTLENYIRKYGKEYGTIKYLDYINKAKSYYSKISQECFRKIDEYFNKKYTTYFEEKTKEFGLITSIGYKKLDYYIKELNINIEFNGDRFHANPLFYDDNDTPNPFSDISASKIWENDKIRSEVLKNEFNIETITIWESEYKNNDIINLLKNKKLWNFI